MSDTPRKRGGITMLDATALVTGAGVASVHSRELTEELAGLTLLGWLFLGLAFLWLALTSAGPFVFLVRRFINRPAGYPATSDWLWVALGLPWLIAALYRSGVGTAFEQGRKLYELSLQIGLALAALIALGWMARRWSSMNKEGSPRQPAQSWTELVGSALAITWPLQLGLGFVVMR